jgi:hypothetical protein
VAFLIGGSEKFLRKKIVATVDFGDFRCVGIGILGKNAKKHCF